MVIGKNVNLEELKFGTTDFQKMQIWNNVIMEKGKFGEIKQIRKNAHFEI